MWCNLCSATLHSGYTISPKLGRMNLHNFLDLTSTETTFYVLAVYFGSVAIKKSRHAVTAALTADAAGILAAVIITNLIFG